MLKVNFKCKSCGFYVDCTEEEYKERNGYCEECYEKLSEEEKQ